MLDPHPHPHPPGAFSPNFPACPGERGRGFKQQAHCVHAFQPAEGSHFPWAGAQRGAGVPGTASLWSQGPAQLAPGQGDPGSAGSRCGSGLAASSGSRIMPTPAFLPPALLELFKSLPGSPHRWPQALPSRASRGPERTAAASAQGRGYLRWRLRATATPCLPPNNAWCQGRGHQAKGTASVPRIAGGAASQLQGMGWGGGWHGDLRPPHPAAVSPWHSLAPPPRLLNTTPASLAPRPPC